jgi:hypothetical protein
LFPSIARDVVLLRHRNFHKDAKLCIENLKPPLQVLGKENIPQQGSCVITFNHYHRPGFGAQRSQGRSLGAKAGLSFLPVGAYEADGIFQVHFGKRYELHVGNDLSVEEKDDQSPQLIMENIARLLPVDLRGEFA